jgi:hypothetical protein
MVLDTVRGIDGVTGIHNAHFWQMDEHALRWTPVGYIG